MGRLALLLVMLCGFVAFAQTIPVPPANPLNYFLKSLENEAGLNVRGVITERQTFPPRKEANATRTDFPAPPPLVVGLLRQNWRVTVSNGEQVAGRDSWKLELTPDNAAAPRFTYWMDREWNLRLAVEERDAFGDVTYSARYQSIEKPTKRSQRRTLTRLELRPALEKFVRAQVGAYYLPDGFRLSDVRPRTVRDNQAALDLRASNGLSVIVIVFAPVATPRNAKLAVRDLNGSWVWVIGNLERTELERIAASVKAPLEIAGLLSGFSSAPR
jgi:hypothetical protein